MSNFRLSGTVTPVSSVVKLRVTSDWSPSAMFGVARTVTLSLADSLALKSRSALPSMAATPAWAASTATVTLKSRGSAGYTVPVRVAVSPSGTRVRSSLMVTAGFSLMVTVAVPTPSTTRSSAMPVRKSFSLTSKVSPGSASSSSRTATGAGRRSANPLGSSGVKSANSSRRWTCSWTKSAVPAVPASVATVTGRWSTENMRARSAGAVKVPSRTVRATRSTGAWSPSLTASCAGSRPTVMSGPSSSRTLTVTTGLPTMR